MHFSQLHSSVALRSSTPSTPEGVETERGLLHIEMQGFLDTAILTEHVEALDLRLAAQFVIGGVGETLTAVLVGAITVEREYLIDMLNDLLFASLRAVRTTSGAVRTG